jgi:cytochrome o ubiquinol oxidase operon protein cyoD
MNRRARSRRRGARCDVERRTTRKQAQRNERHARIWKIGLTVAAAAVLAIWRRYKRRDIRPARSDETDTNEPSHKGMAHGVPSGRTDMNEPTCDSIDPAALMQQERRELHSYVWGISLALVLTLIPFALVQWVAVPRMALLITIGAFALVQLVVQFRYFLHVRLGQKREDLQLILFSAFLLFIMVAGTIWIMASLATRMSLPG